MKLLIEVDTNNPESVNQAMSKLKKSTGNYASLVPKRVTNTDRLNEYLNATIARNNRLLALGKTLYDCQFDVITRGFITEKMRINPLTASKWLKANRDVIDSHHASLGLNRNNISMYARSRNAAKQAESEKPRLRLKVASAEMSKHIQYVATEWRLKAEEFQNKANYKFDTAAKKAKWIGDRMRYLVEKHDRITLSRFGTLASLDIDATFEVDGNTYVVNPCCDIAA